MKKNWKTEVRDWMVAAATVAVFYAVMFKLATIAYVC